MPDYTSAARRIGELDWHRSAPLWSEIVRERVDKEGNTVLGLAGGGAQTRRFITRVVRSELGLDELLRERGFVDEDNSETLDLEAA